MSPKQDRSPMVVVPCTDLDAAIRFYCDEVGFRIERIWPADSPRQAIVGLGGLRLCLELTSSLNAPPPLVRIEGSSREPLCSPDGGRVEFADAPRLTVPSAVPSAAISRFAADASWERGRAGMRYRDLIADRHGGRTIASHIEIADAGPVADYVHYHDVRVQLLYVWRGWVRVVYEGQGAPFVFAAGDCILQPPKIRHRVLESSAGLSVIELTSPAEHFTYGDQDYALPDAPSAPLRTWSGQAFIHHRAAAATWSPWRLPGWQVRDCGVGLASGGVAEVSVARAKLETDAEAMPIHEGEVVFLFVSGGRIEIACPEPVALNPGDAITIPPALPVRMRALEAGTEILEVRL